MIGKARRVALLGALAGATSLGSCGSGEGAPHSAAPARAAARERLSVLVGRRGPVVFLVFPKAWGAGYDEAAFDARAHAAGVPLGRAIYEVVAVHTGSSHSGSSAEAEERLDIDPRSVELVLTRRGEAVARGTALARVEEPAGDARDLRARLALWRAWCGPLDGVPPDSVARWTYVLDAPERPLDLEGAPIEGRLEWQESQAQPGGAITVAEQKEPVWLGTWRVDEARFLRHLGSPGGELLRVAEIKNAFRGEPRAPRRG